MNILLLYISPNKTTDKISRALSARFTRDGHTVKLLNTGKRGHETFDRVGPAVFQGIDLIGIGSPVYHMRILEPLQAFLREALPHLGAQTRTFIYLTYGGITTGKALIHTARLLSERHIPIAGAFKVWAPHFYNPVSYPNPAALQTVDEFCARLSAEPGRRMDWQRIQQAFANPNGKVKFVYPLTEVLGKLRELPIDIDPQKCIQCKRCSNECPANAMSMAPYPTRDNRKCIYCYHCTTICPQRAISSPTEKIEKMVQINKKILGCEQPRNAALF